MDFTMEDCNESNIIEPGARSPTNAHIVLIGLTGAGKSTTLNMLFDGADCHGKERYRTFDSATTEIQEYAASLKSGDDTEDRQLVIIDTPGFGDTRDAKFERDSRVLATLENYLGTHAVLSKYFPLAVLLVVKFDDVRIQAETSYFVQMLKALEFMVKNGTLIDTHVSFCNLIVVFTHVMNENDKRLVKNPEKRVNLIKGLISRFTSIKGEVSFVMAENKGKSHKLRIVNNYFHMPNGEYYPLNLFERIQKLAVKSEADVGEEIFVDAFKNPRVLNEPRSINIRLLDTSHPHVKKFRSQLEHSKSIIRDTQLAKKLKSIWDLLESQIDGSSKTDHAFSITIAQGIFQERGIEYLHQLPNTNIEILNLLSSFTMNPFLEKTLRKLNINPPYLNIDQCGVGKFYNIKTDTVVSRFAMNIEEKEISAIGFEMPACYRTEIVEETADFACEYSAKNEYMQKRLEMLKLSSVFGSAQDFSFSIKPGHNIVQQNTSDVTLTGIRELRRYHVTLSNNVKADKSILKTLRDLGDYNDNTRDQWRDWFSKHSSHFIRKGYLGGYVRIKATLKQKTNRSASVEEVYKFLNLILKNIGHEENAMGYLENTGWQFDLSFYGGHCVSNRPTIHNLFTNQGVDFYNEWADSILVNPILLQSEMTIECITSLLQNQDLFILLGKFSNAMKIVTNFDPDANKYVPMERAKVEKKLKKKKRCIVM